MEQQFLIDSNAVIDFLAARFPPEGTDFMNETVDAVPVISVITKIEVLSYNAPARDASLISNFISACIVLGLSDEIADQTIAIRKRYKVKMPDAIIAATAIAYNMILISRNTRDFRNISGLTVVDPWLI